MEEKKNLIKTCVWNIKEKKQVMINEACENGGTLVDDKEILNKGDSKK